MLKRDCRGFCKGRLFCDVYVIWEKEGGISYEFLNFHGGRRVCDSIFFTETEFYCMVEVGKRDCGGLPWECSRDCMDTAAGKNKTATEHTGSGAIGKK